MDRTREAWAVFWCALLNPLIVGEITDDERADHFRKLSQEERRLPNGQYRRISERTLRRQWRRFREEGVSGLVRRRRSDRGKPRKKQADLLARAVELKKEQPGRSAHVLNTILRAELGRQVPRSTLHHHLRREGATRRKLGLSKEKIRCRWTRDQTNALWVGDFEHGPIVMHQGVAVKAYLTIWIDCFSRYLVGARYYLRENLCVLTDSLLRAWAEHGASRELYVDNAKVFHANALQLACGQLNIKLHHRPPLDPPAGGIIERAIQTLQMQFEAEVKAANVMTLDELNRYLQAWLTCDYRVTVHSETGQTPEQRYQDGNRFTRHVDLPSVISFFHRQEERTVHDDFCDVQLNHIFFAVDAKFKGDKVVVHYDPYAIPLEEVRIYSPGGVYLGIGRRHQREKRESTPTPPAQPVQPIEPRYLEVLRAEHEKLQQEQRQIGIDYHSARQRNVWSLNGFVRQFARLMGKSGGLSAFSASELETLQQFHARYDHADRNSTPLTETLLRQAFERAESPSIPLVLFQLQFLLNP